VPQITVQGPSLAAVPLGQTAQFTAVVQNMTNTSVTWEVNSVAGGNATIGTISSTGLYTAPTTIPSPNQIQITAVSMANASLSGSTTVTLDSNISVSISPQNLSVFPGQTQQFVVTLQNAINVAVTWEVNGVAGGTTTTGTISGTGLYTAPATVSSATNVTVSAVSVADPSKSGPATVTVNPAVSVSVSPLVDTMLVGKTLQFNATLQNTNNTSVTWQIAPQGAQVGSISSSGLYTAPASVSGPTPVAISATSAADPLQSGTAWILVHASGPNDAALKGRYVFALPTQCGSCASLHFTLQAGSIVADGAGNITSGIAELVPQSRTGWNWNSPNSLQNVIGAYTISADNQGTVYFLSETGGQANVASLSVALGSFHQGIAARANIPYGTGQQGSGAMLLQDPSALSASAIEGDYAFGSSVGTVNEALEGVFHADGAGNMSSGFLDANYPFPGDPALGLELSNAPFTGAYSVDASSGRGTATLNIPNVGTANVTFYVISAGQLFWLGLTPAPNSQVFSGTAVRQVGGPFSPSSLKGTSVFALGGAGLSGEASVGLVKADGSGSLSGIVDGIVDQSGNVQTNQAFAGTYAVSASGRGTLNIFNQTFVIYVVNQNSAFILEAPNNPAVQSGLLEPQAAGPFGTGSISGSFTSGGASTPLDETIGPPFPLFGTFSSDGAGTITGDTNGNPDSFSATYSVSSNGRGTMSPSSQGSGSLVFYMIAPNAFVALLSFFAP
jgi:hypothetical protein